MENIFASASSFNSDISKWNVPRVISMNGMFFEATSFNQKLCGANWINSKASMESMFKGSSGRLSQEVCALPPTTTRAWRQYQYLPPTTTGDWRQYQYSPPPYQNGLHQPISERYLIVRKSFTTSISTLKIASTMTCSKCGTFDKSGRVSCCAPGGAWFKNCGGLGSKNVDHRWSEGVAACERKFQ